MDIFGESDELKEIMDIWNETKGLRTKFTAEDIKANRAIAIFRYTSLGYDAAKDKKRRAAPLHYALLEAQPSFLDARRNLLTYHHVRQLRMTLVSIMRTTAGLPATYEFPWWDGITISAEEVIEQSIDMDELRADLGIASQWSKDLAALTDFRKKIETNELLVLDPGAPVAKRMVSKTTSELVDKLLEVNTFTISWSFCLKSFILQQIARTMNVRRRERFHSIMSSTGGRSHDVLPIPVSSHSISREFTDEEILKFKLSVDVPDKDDVPSKDVSDKDDVPDKDNVPDKDDVPSKDEVEAVPGNAGDASCAAMDVPSRSAPPTPPRESLASPFQSPRASSVPARKSLASSFPSPRASSVPAQTLLGSPLPSPQASSVPPVAAQIGLGQSSVPDPEDPNKMDVDDEGHKSPSSETSKRPMDMRSPQNDRDQIKRRRLDEVLVVPSGSGAITEDPVEEDSEMDISDVEDTSETREELDTGDSSSEDDSNSESSSDIDEV